MSNPRKFSEKIQIQLQKQEEETRRFNETMQEAQLVKVLYTGQSPNQQTHHLHHHPNQTHQISHASRSQHLVPSFPPYRGGSLPNVNQMANMHTAAGIDLQNALESLEMLRTDRDPSPRSVRHPSPTPGPGKARHYSPNKRPMEYDPRMPPSYLSPPDQNTHLTKRAHSDSALHQSANPHNLDVNQMGLGGSFTPTRRSPVPDKLMDAHYLWGDPTKVGMHRPKSCDIPGMSGLPEQQHSAQQQQQQQSHLLSPTSMPQQQQQSTPSTNPTTGSLPDLTNPAMNFPTLVAPLDTEDAQGYSVNKSGQQVYMPNQIRAPSSHSSSASPQNMRRMRGPDSNGLNGPQRKSSHPAQNPPYMYQPAHLAQQNFNSYRSNSSSPGIPMQEHMNMGNSSASNPSSPANAPQMPYNQDPHYIDMQQTVQHKFEQITMDHTTGHPSNMPDPYMTNLFNAFVNSDFMQRSQGNDVGQIPDIIFTGPGLEDPSGLRGEYSTLLPPTSSSSSMNSHPFHQHQNSNDSYSGQSHSQETVDLFDVLQLDKYDLGMLNDVNLGHMVDPETEEQFRLDNNVQ